MSKKAQVTLFVILGVVVLIVVGIFIYLFSQSQLVNVEETTVFETAFDARVAPVVESVNSCLFDLTKEALTQSAFRGGHLDISDEFYRVNMIPAYNNNALELFDDSGIVLPYWYSISSAPDCFDCSYELNRPLLEGNFPGTIQSDVQNFVNANIINCVDSFRQFSSEFDVEFGSPIALVSFNDDDVFVGLDWPLIISIVGDDAQFSVDAFTQNLDVDFKSLYDLASDVLFDLILDYEDQPLESFSVEVSDYLSLGSDGLIPPRAQGNRVESSPKVWFQSDVNRIFREKFAELTPFIQVENSLGYSVVSSFDDEFRRNTYSRFLYSLDDGDDSLSRTSVSFSYLPFWPFYSRVKPSSGEVIMPDISTFDIPFFPISISRYSFSYDLSYPVLISLEDSSAFGGEGLLFQFPVEANIRSSGPYSNEFIDFSRIAIG